MGVVLAAEFRGRAGLGFLERDPLAGSVANPEIRIQALAFDLAVGAGPVLDEGIEAVEFGRGLRTTERRQEAPLSGLGKLHPGREDRGVAVGLHAEQE